MDAAWNAICFIHTRHVCLSALWLIAGKDPASQCDITCKWVKEMANICPVSRYSKQENTGKLPRKPANHRLVRLHEVSNP